MPTITLDLPESTYRDALSFDVTERVRLFAVALRTARAIEEAEEDPDVPDYDRPTDEADLEAIGRGLASRCGRANRSR